VGFSSLVWSHAVGPSGSVTGLEFSPEYAAQAEEAFKAQGVSNVKIVVGDALEQLPLLEPAEPYDLIFVDAQKTGYPAYLAAILEKSKPGASGGKRLLRKGGLIVADNTLRRGLVADDSEANPHRAHHNPREFDKGGNLEKVKEFNDLVHRDERLEAVVLPLWDGLVLARLVD
jgi:predicted O-methyltransferase YrrM